MRERYDRLIAHPRTTAAGIAAAVFVLHALYHQGVTIFFDENWWFKVLTCLVSLAAADAHPIEEEPAIDTVAIGFKVSQ